MPGEMDLPLWRSLDPSERIHVGTGFDLTQNVPRTRFLEPLIRHADALSGEGFVALCAPCCATVNLPAAVLTSCQLFRYQRDKSALFAGTIVNWPVIAGASSVARWFARLRYQVNPY